MGADARALRELVRRLDALGRVTDEPGRLTRTFLSPAMRRANALVSAWMRADGLSVREDAAGNLIGRLDSAHPQAKTLLLGSHLDTVRDAGKFDGALGVLLPLAALSVIRSRGATLPFSVEVIGFSEEEGVRFASAYLGSKAYAGTLAVSDLRRTDESGTSVREALEVGLGARPFRIPPPAHRPSDLLGYLEAHIEQGPVLEAAGLAVGAVSAIAGQTRGRVAFRGRAGHAGTTPMASRRDALAAAAEWILAVEAFARPRSPLVATVGTCAVSPGSPNVIPGEAVLSLDLRHPRDRSRAAALGRMISGARRIARRRGVSVEWTPTQDDAALACSAALTRELAASIRTVQGKAPFLVSGAGHDAVAVSHLAPVAMLFVRCRDGLSHHPDEFASQADLRAALRVFADFLGRVARREGGA